jgi:hypothetical protein
MDKQDPPNRSWTDEQLREAVASEHSWRGVLRALGLKPHSSGAARTVRKRASKLGLDASHFTGQRRWSDAMLRDAVARAPSWSGVICLLGASDDSFKRLKWHARRLGLDTSHFQWSLKEREPVDVHTARPQPKMLRAAAQSIATAWFTLQGLPVAVPTEPQAYDLLVTMPDGVQRVQVKSTTCRTTTGTWNVGIGRRPYTLDKTAGRAPYDPDSIDLFFIISADGAIYLIPGEVLEGRTQIFLSVCAAYRFGNASSLLDWGDGPESVPA